MYKLVPKPSVYPRTIYFQIGDGSTSINGCVLFCLIINFYYYYLHLLTLQVRYVFHGTLCFVSTWVDLIRLPLRHTSFSKVPLPVRNYVLNFLLNSRIYYYPTTKLLNFIFLAVHGIGTHRITSKPFLNHTHPIFHGTCRPPTFPADRGIILRTWTSTSYSHLNFQIFGPHNTITNVKIFLMSSSSQFLPDLHSFYL